MSPRRALFGSILLCLVAWQIAACTVMQPGRELVIWRGCDGKDHAADVTVHVGIPAIDCPLAALRQNDAAAFVEFTLGFPTLACAVVGPENEERVRMADVWLAPLNFDFAVRHEMEHVKGHTHPRFIPFVHSDECPT